jgi:hypothetical protein
VLTLSTGSAPAAAAKGGRKAAGASAKGSSSEPGVAIELDGEGIAEHALQVAMMLPGGLAVLGLYLFAPESGYASCTSQLAATLSAIAADAAAAAAAASSSGGSSNTSPQQQQELLLLHVDSTSRKFSMRTCLASAGAAAAAGSLKPVPDFKFGPSLASLVPLRTCHAFDITLPAGAAGATLQALLADAAAAEAGRVMASLALLSGAAPAAPSQQLGDLLSAAAAGSSSGKAPAWVDLYCSPPPATAGAGNSSSGNCSGKGSSSQAASSSSSSSYVGSVRLQGCIQALAYAHRRDSAAKALTELKQDVAASLAARLAAVADEALAAAADAADAAEGAAAPAGTSSSSPAHPLLAEAGSAGRSLCGLPRRVLLPWADLGLQVRVTSCEAAAWGLGAST